MTANSLAWETLVKEYYPRIYAYALKLLGSEADAEDIAQEVFLKAFKSKKQDLSPLALKQWLYVVARNRCIDKQRWWKRRRLLFQSGELEGQSSSANEPTIFLSRLLTKIPPRQREVFILRHWHDFSTQATAKLLGISTGTVKSSLKKAIHTIKEELKKEQESNQNLS
ncbi:RNA polymerase sigma factor [Oligoflexia bacterium]|nr:RNA polymerase sigma factor [Oligoflexia bacterium]